MTDSRIIHVRIIGGVDDNQLEMYKQLIEDLAAVDEHTEVVVSDDRAEIHEYPALDDYADELADRVVRRLREDDEE